MNKWILAIVKEIKKEIGWFRLGPRWQTKNVLSGKNISHVGQRAFGAQAVRLNLNSCHHCILFYS